MRGSQMVSTVKTSVARIPRAWLRRNSAQVGPPRRGAGPSPMSSKERLGSPLPTAHD